MREPRKRVYVVRHGSTVWNEQGRIVGHRDLGLSELGLTQVEGAREMLAACRLDLALSSPLARTRQTAEAVLRGREVALELEPRLVELKLKGWEGRTRQDLRLDPSWQRWLAAPQTEATPEGERLEDVRARALPALAEALLRTPPGGGLALFTHGGVARVLLLSLLGMPLSDYQRLRCDCASVSALEVTDGGALARLLALNLTRPLLALSERPAG